MFSILVVEDDPGIAETLEFLLQNAGYLVDIANTGMLALSLLEKNNFSLILLDLHLPDSDGLDLLKKIRQDSSTAILIVTARDEAIDKVVGLELGADDYVTKPFHNRELLARIKAILRREQKKSNIFEIHSPSQRIFYRSKVLDLSLQEYRILSLLLSQPGWIFSREKIAELAWQDSAAVFDRTIDAHIKNIRQKLSTIDSKSSPIITHRGMGYSIAHYLL